MPYSSREETVWNSCRLLGGGVVGTHSHAHTKRKRETEKIERKKGNGVLLVFVFVFVLFVFLFRCVVFFCYFFDPQRNVTTLALGWAGNRECEGLTRRGSDKSDVTRGWRRNQTTVQIMSL